MPLLLPLPVSFTNFLDLLVGLLQGSLGIARHLQEIGTSERPTSSIQQKIRIILNLFLYGEVMHLSIEVACLSWAYKTSLDFPLTHSTSVVHSPSEIDNLQCFKEKLSVDRQPHNTITFTHRYQCLGKENPPILQTTSYCPYHRSVNYHVTSSGL